MQFKDSKRPSTASNYNTEGLGTTTAFLPLQSSEQPHRAAAEPTQRGTGPATGPGIVFLDTRSPQSPLWYHTHKAGRRFQAGSGTKCPPSTAIPSVHWNPACSSFSPTEVGKLQASDLQSNTELHSIPVVKCPQGAPPANPSQ